MLTSLSTSPSWSELFLGFSTFTRTGYGPTGNADHGPNSQGLAPDLTTNHDREQTVLNSETNPNRSKGFNFLKHSAET